jgi:hypothetical protein
MSHLAFDSGQVSDSLRSRRRRHRASIGWSATVLLGLGKLQQGPKIAVIRMLERTDVG